MHTHRRAFLSNTSRVTAGFLGLRALEALADEEKPEYGYGQLLVDPKGILSLPAGFSYRIISRKGSKMDDGLVVPGAPDGMATFAGPYGLTVIIRNHELNPEHDGAFGKKDALLGNVDRSKLYDAGTDLTTCAGGTTTIVFDTKRQRVVRQFLSLGGTSRNCAGGPTPWGSWITCEETEDLAGHYEKTNVTIEKDHGYNFEVPVTPDIAIATPEPLRAMGRFRHEAIAVDTPTSIVYQTEDQDDGLIYRFLPNTPQKLSQGGRLQVLCVKDRPSLDTRNWETESVAVGDKLVTYWLDIDDVESPESDLRLRGFESGAARFARGEGMWRGDNREVYFAATSGGKRKKGQIWKYTPCPEEGREGNNDSGALELFVESTGGKVVQNADNLTVAPWGDLMVCEDRVGTVVRLIGVTPQGQQYPFAFNHTGKELAGVCFSPDGSTLFVNIQHRGWTLAITGPWHDGVA